MINNFCSAPRPQRTAGSPHASFPAPTKTNRHFCPKHNTTKAWSQTGPLRRARWRAGGNCTHFEKFRHRVELTYLSCSPYRAPVARLALRKPLWKKKRPRRRRRSNHFARRDELHDFLVELGRAAPESRGGFFHRGRDRPLHLGHYGSSSMRLTHRLRAGSADAGWPCLPFRFLHTAFPP